MGVLSEEVVTQINQHVYARFPEVEGIQPAQRRAPAGSNVILTYRQKSATEDGLAIERVVRATVTPKGQVIKISTSR
jgi:hypothetical protein